MTSAIESMTGYGAASVETDAGTARAEIKTVNNRFADASIRLPGELAALEAPLRETVQRAIKRGKAQVFISWKTGAEVSSAPRFSEENLAAIVAQWSDMSTRLRLPRLTAAALAALPGVLAQHEAPLPEDTPEEAKEAVERAVADALEQLAESRRAEGERLAEDLAARVGTIESLTGQIEEGAGEVIEAGKERLRQRWEEFAAQAASELPPGRVETELLGIADRADISEELTRLRAHVAAFRDLLAADSGEPVGKRMDFLLQEFGREANTIASKSRSTRITPLALEMKHELEKMREQVQNIA